MRYIKRMKEWGLTEAEKEIFQLTLQGLGRREMAHIISRSPQAVRARIAGLLRKSGARDRMQLLARLLAAEVIRNSEL